MKLKTAFVNLALLAVTCAFCLLLGEGIARLALRPADFLSVERVPDEVLGVVPSSSTRPGGFDDWGFRNSEVPGTADIVVIGDSQTYGNGVRMEDTWPYVLGRLMGRRVYNMSLAGYGPNQYLHLLETKALSLNPRMIVVALALGDDFENAYMTTYRLDHWAYLRALPPEKVDRDDINTRAAPVELAWHNHLRGWLAGHSMMYQLIVHGPVLGRIRGEIEIQNALRLFDSVSLLRVPDKNISEAFSPKESLLRNDLQSASIREGLRITLELLTQMSDICRQHHVEFLVAVIPTKEMVFAEYFDQDPDLALGDVLHRVVENERLAREELFAFFSASSIAYADALPALQRAAEHKIFTRSARDIHPRRDGYRLIAEAVFEEVKKDQGAGGQGSDRLCSEPVPPENSIPLEISRLSLTDTLGESGSSCGPS